MTDLTGKTAIVTGGGRGLGLAMATALAEAGANVTVTARSTSELESFAQSQRQLGRNVVAVASDVSDEASVDSMVARTLAHFGRIDILINNAGILATRDILDQDVSEWDRVIDTNLRGTFLVTRSVGRHFAAQRSGKVINIASNFGLVGVSSHSAYSASKAAIIGFTRSIAVEWARYGIQVNALAPGYFATDLNRDMRADSALTDKVVRSIPARRLGAAQELTPWILLLAGDASDFMTGECIVIDGGQTIR